MFQLVSVIFFLAVASFASAFHHQGAHSKQLHLLTISCMKQRIIPQRLQMNFFNDAFRYFSNLKKEASAKHILIKGPTATMKCNELKDQILKAEDLSVAFSEVAAKYSECPSANRGGNLGTFKPGMMVKEFDEVCFEKEVGVVHGPVETQFGSHLILITRRYEGEKK